MTKTNPLLFSVMGLGSDYRPHVANHHLVADHQKDSVSGVSEGALVSRRRGPAQGWEERVITWTPGFSMLVSAHSSA